MCDAVRRVTLLRTAQKGKELWSEYRLTGSESSERLEISLVSPSKIRDERQSPLDIQKLSSQIDVYPLGTFDTLFGGLLLANAKVENLRTKILVDSATEVNFIGKEFCNENAVRTK